MPPATQLDRVVVVVSTRLMLMLWACWLGAVAVPSLAGLKGLALLL